jgi:hypothetical protein
MRFMFESLANRDNPNFVVALGVGNSHHDTFQQAKRNIARLAIAFAGIFDGDQQTIKDTFGVAKINPMFGEIDLSLCFIPREHRQSVATIRRYVKLWENLPICKLTWAFIGRPKAVRWNNWLGTLLEKLSDWN